MRLAGVMTIGFLDHHIDHFHVIHVVKGKPRVLILEFLTQRYRNIWLQAKRVKEDIYLQDLISSEQRIEIFLSELSTAVERRCLFDAKAFAKKENY